MVKSSSTFHAPVFTSYNACMKTILVINDSSLLRDFLEKQLTEYGFNVIQAINGLDGWSKIRQQRPDLVIMDLMMEDVDAGTRLVREIKALAPGIPVFMLSSTGDYLDRAVDTSELGFQGVFQKPIDPKILLRLLRAKLGRPPADGDPDGGGAARVVRLHGQLVPRRGSRHGGDPQGGLLRVTGSAGPPCLGRGHDAVHVDRRAEGVARRGPCPERQRVVTRREQAHEKDLGIGRQKGRSQKGHEKQAQIAFEHGDYKMRS